MPTEHNPQTGSTSLKRMILGQAMEATAIPMVLFSSDTMAATGRSDRHPEPVVQTADGQGIDLDGLELFSFEAYRLQSALGEGLAP